MSMASGGRGGFTNGTSHGLGPVPVCQQLFLCSLQLAACQRSVEDTILNLVKGTKIMPSAA